MAIMRTTAIWTGFTGAPGYSNFYFLAFGGGDSANAEVQRTRDMFQFMATLLPDDVTITVQQECAVLEESTGELIDYVQADTAPNPVNGTVATGYSAPSGAAITWNTDAVARGRRLRGRTFIVPLAGSAYQDDGTLTSNAIEGLTLGAEALIGDGTGPQAQVWSRPRNGTGGSVGAITSARIADKAAILRSRRD